MSSTSHRNSTAWMVVVGGVANQKHPTKYCKHRVDFIRKRNKPGTCTAFPNTWFKVSFGVFASPGPSACPFYYQPTAIAQKLNIAIIIIVCVLGTVTVIPVTEFKCGIQFLLHFTPNYRTWATLAHHNTASSSNLASAHPFCWGLLHSLLPGLSAMQS